MEYVSLNPKKEDKDRHLEKGSYFNFIFSLKIKKGDKDPTRRDYVLLVISGEKERGTKPWGV